MPVELYAEMLALASLVLVRCAFAGNVLRTAGKNLVAMFQDASAVRRGVTWTHGPLGVCIGTK